MKNIWILTGLLLTLVGFNACSTAEDVANNETPSTKLVESAKEPEVIAFQQALAKQLRNKTSLSGKENDKVKNNEAVNETAKNLLTANGFSIPNMEGKNTIDETVVRNMALKLLAEKTKLIYNN